MEYHFDMQKLETTVLYASEQFQLVATVVRIIVL